MKQKIRVVGLVRNGEGILVLKRNRGRSEAPVFWELPTGKIKFGEQPEEAMARALSEYTGLSTVSIKLKDVISFLALEGSSQLSNLYIVYEVSFSESDKIQPRERYSSYKFVKDFSNGFKLNEASLSVIDIEHEKISPAHISSSRAAANGVAINVDGASRGNPGPSGVGYCIYDVDGKIIERGGEFIGFATSRVAEYYAMRKGIERAIELGFKTVRLFSDSLMVVNQLNGIFHIKNQDTLLIYHDIKKLLKNFDAISFSHIQRSENSAADKEANLAIDKILGK